MSLPLSLRALLLITALVAVAAGSLLSTWSSRNAAEPSGPSIEKLALPDIDGSRRSLSEWRGKIVLLNFWATWCAPCREEIPLLKEMQTEHAEQGLQIVGVAIDDPSEVTAFHRRFRINYPILLGNLDTLSLAAQTGNAAQALPYTLILSREGRVLSTKIGAYTRPEIEAVLRGALATASAQ